MNARVVHRRGGRMDLTLLSPTSTPIVCNTRVCKRLWGDGCCFGVEFIPTCSGLELHGFLPGPATSLLQSFGAKAPPLLREALGLCGLTREVGSSSWIHPNG